jgi:hypothetical protein
MRITLVDEGAAQNSAPPTAPPSPPTAAPRPRTPVAGCGLTIPGNNDHDFYILATASTTVLVHNDIIMNS